MPHGGHGGGGGGGGIEGLTPPTGPVTSVALLAGFASVAWLAVKHPRVMGKAVLAGAILCLATPTNDGTGVAHSPVAFLLVLAIGAWISDDVRTFHIRRPKKAQPARVVRTTIASPGTPPGTIDHIAANTMLNHVAARIAAAKAAQISTK